MKSTNPSLNVIIPVYNESSTIREILRKVTQISLVKEVVIVDDYSIDGTRSILKEIESEHTKSYYPYKLKVIYQDKNIGKGSAIRRGIKEVSGDLTIIQDADLEYEPNDYEKLVKPITNGIADVVYGSRFYYSKPLSGHTFGNKILTFLSNLTTRLHLTDMETCYKLFKTEIIKKIHLTSNRFGFEPEVTAKIAKSKYRIYEIPISYKKRDYKEGKKINWKDGFQAVWIILKYWLKS